MCKHNYDPRWRVSTAGGESSVQRWRGRVSSAGGEKCPALAGKRKMIFVQACQGQDTDPGTTVLPLDGRHRHTSQDNNTATYKIPNYADFVIFQASFWQHYSFRSGDTGSWFIQALCRQIDRSAPEDAFFDILLDVFFWSRKQYFSVFTGLQLSTVVHTTGTPNHHDFNLTELSLIYKVVQQFDSQVEGTATTECLLLRFCVIYEDVPLGIYHKLCIVPSFRHFS